MTSTRSALDADWLGVCRARGGRASAPAGRRSDHGGAGARDGHAGQRRRPHARDRPGRRRARVRTSSTDWSERGVPVHGRVRGARRDRLRRRRRPRDHRPDRRLAQRQARHPHLRAVDRRGRRARRWPTSPSGSCTTSDPRSSGGRGGAAAPGWTAPRSIRRSPSAAGATGGSRCSASSPPIRAGCQASIDAAGGQRLPPARARDDRRVALSGGRRAVRRDGVAAALARRRRGRRAVDRARGGRRGQLPLVRSAARRRR